jgi:hypothetical protein
MQVAEIPQAQFLTAQAPQSAFEEQADACDMNVNCSMKAIIITRQSLSSIMYPWDVTHRVVSTVAQHVLMCFFLKYWIRSMGMNES